MSNHGVPYIYAPPQRYSNLDPYGGFNPRAYSQATLVPRAAPKPKQEGPLLDFNRHPDSFLILPYGETNSTPLSPKTRNRIISLRWVQFALRVAEMLGALGMLVCVICLKDANDSESYILRVPPALDILILAYALYHLIRPAKGRTPASSASYHFFATIVDIGIIPFYVFIALLSKSKLSEDPTAEDAWSSFFTVAGATDKIILSTWLIAMTLGGLHVVSTIISLWLVYMFRKISNLPPDQNPLEDNLTSRPKRNKHKYKNSELSATTLVEGDNGSHEILAPSGRTSPTKTEMTSDVRPISFLQTRTKSAHVYSPHNPISAEASRSSVALPLPGIYYQPQNARNSRPDIADTVTVYNSESEKQSEVSHRFMSEPSSHLPTMKSGSSVYSTVSSISTPPLPRKSSKRQSLLSDNWFTYKQGIKEADENSDPAISIVEEEESEVHDAHQRDSAISLDFRGLGYAPKSYAPVSQTSAFDDDRYRFPVTAPAPTAAPPPLKKPYGQDFQPLGMNPPTPPMSRQEHRAERPLAVTSGNVMDSRASTPSKSKYYGDLASAMQGIRASPTATPTPRSSPRGAVKQQQQQQQGPALPKNPRANLKETERRDWAMTIEEHNRKIDEKGRSISSGLDLGVRDSGVDFDGEEQRVVKKFRSRNVSGKTAEEGRGGYGFGRWR